MCARRDKEAFPSRRGSRPNRTSILNTTGSELIFNGQKVPNPVLPDEIVNGCLRGSRPLCTAGNFCLREGVAQLIEREDF